MTELLELRGVVEAAPDAGRRAPARRAARRPVPARGARRRPTRWTATSSRSCRTAARSPSRVDRAARSVTQQGEWWYRGVTIGRAGPARVAGGPPDLQRRARAPLGGAVRLPRAADRRARRSSPKQHRRPRPRSCDCAAWVVPGPVSCSLRRHAGAEDALAGGGDRRAQLVQVGARWSRPAPARSAGSGTTRSAGPGTASGSGTARRSPPASARAA